ncbi:MAG: efflux RND transporter periplasmic adaptor subunit [Bradymonadia bacterium]
MKINTLTALTLAGLCLACEPPKDGDAQGDPKADAPAADTQVDAAVQAPKPVEVLSMTPQLFEEKVELPATVETPRDATLSAETLGTVIRLPERGELVQARKPVAILEADLARATLTQTEAALRSAKAVRNLARADHRRQKPLLDAQIISALEFEGITSRLAQAEAAVAQAEAQVQQAKAQIRDTRLLAPFTGTVEQRFVEVGEQVSPGQPVVRLVDVGEVKIIAGVPERYAADIAIGAPTSVSFSAYGLPEITGKVSFVGRTVDAADRTFPVEVKVSNPEGRLKPQMVARMHLTRSRIDDALVVPASALIRHERGQSLFIVEDGKSPMAKRVDVKLGPRGDGRVVIAEGLSPGDRVVVKGQASLSGGDLLEIESSQKEGGAP